MRDRKMRYKKNAGLENAGMENSAQKCRTGKCCTTNPRQEDARKVSIDSEQTISIYSINSIIANWHKKQKRRTFFSNNFVA